MKQIKVEYFCDECGVSMGPAPIFSHAEGDSASGWRLGDHSKADTHACSRECAEALNAKMAGVKR